MKQTEIEKLSAQDLIDKVEDFKKKIKRLKNDTYDFAFRKSHTNSRCSQNNITFINSKKC